MTTPLSDHHRADEPLDHPRDDTLGRAPFAERIAQELAASGGHERFVVSLNGDGGSGKTTLKNFIRHYIAEAGKPGRLASPWFDFNPWEWSGQATLQQAFVEQIGAQLAIHADPVVRALTEPWQKFGAALASPAAGKSITPVVREKREALCTQLRALPFPIIVCIDDVDRLAPADVRELAQLVTTRAALPNFTCFLLFETQPVVAALAGAGASGSDFLHKVVQLEIEMPDAPESLLRQQLERGLADILAPVTFPARPRERWNDVLASAVWPLFSTPRDVKRFLASFAFQFAGHFRVPLGVLEVNPIDLVLVEALRMFAHPVFVELRDTFRRRETRLVRLMSGRDEERKEARVEIDRVVEESPFQARKKRVLTTLLQHLVPPGTGGGHGCREDWDRDLRLCSPRHVERYFHLGAIADAVPASRLIEIVRATGDRSKLELLLLQAAKDGVLPEVLDRLPAVLDPLPESHVPLAAAALCGICDQLPKDSPADMENRLVRFAADLFARLKNAMKREDIVAALLEDPERLTGPILLMHQLRPRTDGPGAVAGSSLSIEQFRRLVKPAAARLRDAAISGAIWQSREYGALIRRWWEWSANKEGNREWMLEQLKQPDHARAWLRTFIDVAAAPGPHELVLQLEDLGTFCDPTALAAAAAQPGGDNVDRATVRSLGMALAPKGSASATVLRTLVVKLDAEAA
jgi:hypothetical protein